MRIRGLWFPLLLCGMFWVVIVYAIVEKVDDNSYKITKSTTATYDLAQRKNLIEALGKDIERKQAEIVQIQNQITDLQKETKDAEDVGVVARDSFRPPVNEMPIKE